ncbi:MAG: hypothetical protein WAQ52_13035 [Terriglobales bacterium]
MKAPAKLVVFVAAGLLTLQLVLAAPAQPTAPSAGTSSSQDPRSSKSVLGSQGEGGASTGSLAIGETTKPGKADGTGDPGSAASGAASRRRCCAGERRPP